MMRSLLLASLLVVLAACGETNAPPATPPTEPAPVVETADPVSDEPALYDEAAAYDDFEPRTPAATAEQNRIAAEPGTRTCPELHAAAIADDVNTIQNILRSGVEIDCREGQHRETALMAAAGAASADAVRFLLDKGADVNARDSGQRTPLWKAQNLRDRLVSTETQPPLVTRLDSILPLLRERGARY